MITTIFYSAVIISLLGLIVATYTDLKERIVPNKLNYALAILGLIVYGTQSYFETNPTPLIYSFLGMCIGFFFGWIMWKIGVFAGGDVKLFMGLGALNPFTPALLKLGLLSSANFPLFPLTLFLHALISFLPYGLFLVGWRVLKNKKFQKELYSEMKPKVISAIHASLFASATYVILIFLKLNPLFTILVLIVWGFLGKNKKYFTALGLICATIINAQLLLQAILAAMIFSVGLYTLIKLLFSTRKVLSTEIKVKELQEGMIPAKSLAWKGKKVIEVETINLKLILKCIKEKNTQKIFDALNPKHEIISGRKARGLSEEELKEVRKLATKGLIPKKMLIKESMPFVPTMLIGYVLCLILGDYFILLLMGGLI